MGGPPGLMQKTFDEVNNWMFYTDPPLINSNLINLRNTLSAADPVNYIQTQLGELTPDAVAKLRVLFDKKNSSYNGKIKAWDVLVYLCQLEGGCPPPIGPALASIKPPSAWQP